MKSRVCFHWPCKDAQKNAIQKNLEITFYKKDEEGENIKSANKRKIADTICMTMTNENWGSC